MRARLAREKGGGAGERGGGLFVFSCMHSLFIGIFIFTASCILHSGLLLLVKKTTRDAKEIDHIYRKYIIYYIDKNKTCLDQHAHALAVAIELQEGKPMKPRRVVADHGRGGELRVGAAGGGEGSRQGATGGGGKGGRGRGRGKFLQQF